ncbi:MAG: hypothetical protein EBU84_10685 [Actinobacteria bacterium]|jgi:hypothetical protein|nr:hypothetical protein [Actinomycetota bacterium]
MEYRNIRVGQKLLLRGQFHRAYEAEVIQVDPRRIPSWGFGENDPVQVKVVLCTGEEPSLLWVNPARLMKPTAD